MLRNKLVKIELNEKCQETFKVLLIKTISELESPPQTQQSKQDEKAEKYPTRKGT